MPIKIAEPYPRSAAATSPDNEVANTLPRPDDKAGNQAAMIMAE
jgi:hypothetical protein